MVVRPYFRSDSLHNSVHSFTEGSTRNQKRTTNKWAAHETKNPEEVWLHMYWTCTAPLQIVEGDDYDPDQRVLVGCCCFGSSSIMRWVPKFSVELSWVTANIPITCVFLSVAVLMIAAWLHRKQQSAWRSVLKTDADNVTAKTSGPCEQKLKRRRGD